MRRLRGLEPPGRDLELVVHVAGSQPPNFELNFSGGAERPEEPHFWFVLDAAIAEPRVFALDIVAGAMPLNGRWETE